MVIKSKYTKKKEKRFYNRQKVYTEKVILCMTPIMVDTWNKKAAKAGITNKEWLQNALMEYNVSWVRESRPVRERPLSRKEERELEADYERRCCGEFTRAELEKWGSSLAEDKGEMLDGAPISFGIEGVTHDPEDLEPWYAKFREIFGCSWYEGFNYWSNREKREEQRSQGLSKTASKRENRQWRKTEDPNYVPYTGGSDHKC